MKIELEDKDVDKIASAVAAKMGGKAAPKKPAASAEVEDEAEAGEAAAEESFEDEAEAGESEAGGEAIDRDDVLKKLKAVTKKTNQADAMAILKKVGGVAKLSQLDEDKFGEVIAACDKALKKAK